MNATNSPKDERIDRMLTRGKDFVALLRDASLLALAILLLVFPHSFNDLLTSAGFEEGSIVGFKWKAKLLQSDDALKGAQTTIASLQEQLQKTTEVLNSTKSAISDPSLKQQIVGLNQENTQVANASSQAQADVKSTIASNASYVERAQSSVISNGGWAVIFGSDVSLVAAKDEIARAAKRGIPNASIYFRNGYYASIVIAESRSAATEYLGIVKSFRQDAYISPIATWCRNMQQREGFTECQSTR
ncbi:MAG: hypothetical protein ABI475_08055 [Methylophilaceae bacterium]